MPEITYGKSTVCIGDSGPFRLIREELAIEQITSGFGAFRVVADDVPESFARGMMELEMGLEIDMDEVVGD